MNKIVLLKDQSGVWWMGTTDATDGPTPPNPIALAWPQLFIEHMKPPTPVQAAANQSEVQLGLGSPFASFRVPMMMVAWTTLVGIPEIENNTLCKMYMQAVQRAKGSGLVVPSVAPPANVNQPPAK